MVERLGPVEQLVDNVDQKERAAERLLHNPRLPVDSRGRAEKRVRKAAVRGSAGQLLQKTPCRPDQVLVVQHSRVEP
ncbi:uncharacterized protein SPSK_08213 [Sporothrix schenckii 1099-18]|uniref:Uncharacterized protein n=1 Tax=Sporothrix schenckii 1099-18 TaxID=1397361 RepID=A0A0F2MGC3_SPOSC|nr:uncharacterized protein SPSK_08213 [Sporothrix schenckii 1099-18]KJR88109.1 hypothetical protein SPSK_08213 [Sporothrix schenckii 1099-18]